MNTAPEDLLQTIDSIYSVALSPAEYERFAEELDAYISGVEPDSAQGRNLLGHIERAISVLEKLYAAGDEETEPQDFVDAEPGAAALCTLDGRILATNQAWKESHGHFEKPVWNIAASDVDQDRIKSAAKILHEVSEQRTNFVRFASDDDEFVHLTISRLSQIEREDGETHYLYRSGKTIWSQAISDLIATEFSLTPAEIELLRRMVLGDSFSEIADDTGKGLETLKSQSKSLYRKMHVNGREDAVRIAFQLHLLLQGGHFIRKPQSMSRRTGYVTQRNGSKIVWTMRGAPDGEPVIFLHGMGLGHGFTRQFQELLKARNIKLICLDRPGYGYSDPPRNWRTNVEEWMESFPVILDELGVDRVPIMTHTSGVLYGCAAASANPDRVEQVCALAGGIPISDTQMLADYPSQVRILSRASRFSPLLLRFVLSSSAAYYRSEKGRNKLMRRTYGDVEVDAQGLEDPEILDLVHQGMEMISLAGFDGFIGDGLRIFNDWSEFVEGMQVPLHYIIGEDDRICPLKWAQAFAQKYAHVEVHSVPGAGQLLHHTHAQAVMQIIEDLQTRRLARRR